MKIDIITVFPLFFNDFLNTSIIKRAIEKKLVKICVHDIRDYAFNKHRQIDDTIYGGGAGMLMTFPPFYEILKKLQTKNSYTILLTPQGQTYHQGVAGILADTKEHIILICGHYEGIDERVNQLVDLELSIGDYVLTGGELPAMIVADSIVRLIDGVINEESFQEDTFFQGLIKYDQYTKPETYKGFRVPEVLLSGHHELIRRYRLENSLRKTLLKRPDLLVNRQLSQEEQKILDQIKQELDS